MTDAPTRFRGLLAAATGARGSRGVREATAVFIIAGALLSAAFAAVAQGTSKEGGAWWLPENVSSQGVYVDRIFYVILIGTVVVFALVQGTLIVFLVKYCSRDGQRAAYVHGNNKLEIIWTAVPALFLAALVFVSQAAWSEIKPSRQFRSIDSAIGAVIIEVVAQQFAWNVRYPGPDGVFGRRNPALVTDSNPIGVDYDDPTALDDVATINQLHIPVDRKIQVKLTSKDVLHSFFLPQFRVKQDAVPGMLVNVFFDAIKVGNYEIACAELCGLGHYRMKGFLTVHDSQESFETWLAERAPTPAH